MKATVFLGGGRITSALVAGLRLAKYDRPLLVHDRNSYKLRNLKRRYNIEIQAEIDKAVAAADRLVIAVRPDSVRELLGELRGLGGPAIGISLAAGIPLALLKRFAPGMKWARAMPSPVCRSGHGLTALVFEPEFPKRERKTIETLFSQTGQVLKITEAEFDAFTVTYSSSHGYHALAVLTHAAEGLGLNRKTAMTAAAHALADGIQYWRDAKGSLDQLLQEATTPGGIAGTVMAQMESDGYDRIIKRGLRAGLARAHKNSRI